jgi:phage-related protein
MAGPGGIEVGRVSVRVMPDLDKFRSTLKTKLEKIERDLRVEIPVEFDTRQALRSVAVLKKRLDSLDRNVNINTRFRDLDKQIRTVGDSAGRAGGQILGMSRYMAIGLGVALLLAPALGVISTLIAGLPSLLFLAAGAFAAIGLGMDGIKKAAEVLKPSIDRLKGSLSATFERTLGPIFEQLNKIFPTLEGGLQRIAVGLSQMAGAFTEVITSKQGLRDIQEILFNTGKFFSQIDTGVKAFTQSLLTLGREGSESFDLLAVGFNTFLSDFNAVVQRVAADGSLRAAFVGLAEVTNSLLSAFNRLFEAGIRVMGPLGGPLASLITGLTDVLVALMPILGIISGLIADVLGQALTALAPIIQQLTPLIQVIANTLGTVLGEAIKILAPILMVLVRILSDSLLSILTVLQPLLAPLLNFFGNMAILLGRTLAEALILIMPFIQQLVQFLVNLMIALEPLLPALFQLADTALKSFLDVLQKLMPDLMLIAGEAMPKFLDAVVKIVPSLVDLITVLADVTVILTDFAILILDFLVPIIQDMARIMGDAWEHVSSMVKGAIDFITGIIKTFVGLFTGDWDMMAEGIKQTVRGLWENVKGAFLTALDAINIMFLGLPGRIISALGNLGGLLIEAGKSLIRGFIEGIQQMVGQAVNKAKEVVSAVRDFFPFSPAKEGAFSGRGYTLYSGMALMTDWARGIEQGTPAAVKAIDEAMNATSGSMELNALVQSDGFGGVGDRVREALSGWTVEIDANGIAQLVNRANRRNERR